MKSKRHNPPVPGSTMRREGGFSLLEILVALFLMTLVFSFVTNVNFTERQALDDITNNLERAIRYSINETAIRNVVIRLHFKLGQDGSGTQEYKVEYGPSGNFVLPAPRESSTVVLSEAEEKALEQETKQLNKKFNRVRELFDETPKFPKSVRLIAVGTKKNKEFYQGQEAALYFYPNGEKDEGIILFGTEAEVIGLAIPAFTFDLEKIVRPLADNPSDELPERQDKLAKEIFEEWLRK
ncbi:MAG: prepilin-type N-terminal cleavage/methylation domain-containing protein [Bdellovibrio sp.]|nr:prepilin-type N-terminal cleavage/methylation domain-containing protein [Bdellovibrio sp.]